MGLIKNYKEKKRQEQERIQREQREKLYSDLAKYGTIINWVAVGFLGFITLMMFLDEPPFTASPADINVYKMSNTLPFLFYTVVAYLQLKHRQLLPLFKENSVPKSIIAWCIVFFMGLSFAVVAEELYSDEYNENYAIYQQTQEDDEEKQLIENLQTKEEQLEKERQQLEEERKQLEEDKQQFEEMMQTNSDDSEKEVLSVTPIVTENYEKTQEVSKFSVHFIDVGQADAALVECDGHYMLIDGGNKDDSSKMYALLKEKNIEVLDIVVATHAHEDHIGGIPGALNYADAELILCPTKNYDSDAFEDFKKYAKENGGIKIPKVGKTYELGDAEIEILGVNSADDEENDTSIVLKITYGDTSFLFTGDAERAAEEVIIDSDVDVSATVLKVGHHGSDAATSYDFFRQVKPEYVVISVGEGNSYGHPHDETLEMLSNAVTTVFRTDLQGDIYCVSDGKTVAFTTEKMVDQETILLSPAAVLKIEQERQAALERERQQAEELARQQAEQEAQDAQKQQVVQQQPSGKMTYIGNLNSHKFHYQSCSTLPKESNRIYFNSRAEAVDAGYTPCGRCKP